MTMRIVRDGSGQCLDLAMVHQNAAAARIDGLPAGSACEGMGALDAFPTLREALWPRYRRVAETGEPWDDEITYRGEQIEGRFHVVVQRLADDLLVQYLVDVTAERSAREEAGRTKNQFLAMLGHELRNPLSPIVTALQLMRLRADRTVERERKVIERQVNHLVRLVDDLLDVSRIARGQLELQHRRVEVSAFVAEAVETASPLLERRRLHLTVDVPQDGLAVDGDPTRLAQIVANLLTNAAKYTEDGGHVVVQARREAEMVAVRVRDDGIGISPDALPIVFDLFTQSPRTIDREQGGLGLGLAIVRDLTAMHGGTVSVHSDGPGLGSEFTVMLRLARQGERAREDVMSAEPRGRTTDSPGGTVLIVDDNEDSAEMLAEAMTALGYTAHVAHEGAAALRIASERRLDLALLDIGLPAMDGCELARRLRTGPGGARLRMIAITGYGQERDVNATREAGFDAHLVKPVDLRRLESTIDSIQGPPATQVPSGASNRP